MPDLPTPIYMWIFKKTDDGEVLMKMGFLFLYEEVSPLSLIEKELKDDILAKMRIFHEKQLEIIAHAEQMSDSD